MKSTPTIITLIIDTIQEPMNVYISFFWYLSFGCFIMHFVVFPSKIAYNAFCITIVIGTIIVPIESYLIKRGCPIPFRTMFYKKIARINFCNMSTNATTLSRMAS